MKLNDGRYETEHISSAANVNGIVPFLKDKYFQNGLQRKIHVYVSKMYIPKRKGY